MNLSRKNVDFRSFLFLATTVLYAAFSVGPFSIGLRPFIEPQRKRNVEDFFSKANINTGVECAKTVSPNFKPIRDSKHLTCMRISTLEHEETTISGEHIAFIVDGNGRWATSRGLPRTAGHAVGANKTVEIVRSAFELGINVVTLYLFSTENWKRPVNEIQNIMSLLERYLLEFSVYLVENKISLRVIGQRNRLPKSICDLLDKTQDVSGSGRTLCLALSYGGRDDLVQSFKVLMEKVLANEISIEDINENLISEHVSTGIIGIKDPDLIIRTSGELRLSNFLLWQTAYSELESVKCNWPDFTSAMLQDIMIVFRKRNRRFGGVGE